MTSQDRTDKELQKAIDKKAIVLSFVIAFILAIGAGLFVHIKNQRAESQNVKSENTLTHGN